MNERQALTQRLERDRKHLSDLEASWRKAGIRVEELGRERQQLKGQIHRLELEQKSVAGDVSKYTKQAHTSYRRYKRLESAELARQAATRLDKITAALNKKSKERREAKEQMKTLTDLLDTIQEQVHVTREAVKVCERDSQDLESPHDSSGDELVVEESDTESAAPSRFAPSAQSNSKTVSDNDSQAASDSGSDCEASESQAGSKHSSDHSSEEEEGSSHAGSDHSESSSGSESDSENASRPRPKTLLDEPYRISSRQEWINYLRNLIRNHSSQITVLDTENLRRLITDASMIERARVNSEVLHGAPRTRTEQREMDARYVDQLIDDLRGCGAGGGHPLLSTMPASQMTEVSINADNFEALLEQEFRTAMEIKTEASARQVQARREQEEVVTELHKISNLFKALARAVDLSNREVSEAQARATAADKRARSLQQQARDLEEQLRALQSQLSKLHRQVKVAENSCEEERENYEHANETLQSRKRQAQDLLDQDKLERQRHLELQRSIEDASFDVRRITDIEACLRKLELEADVTADMRFKLLRDLKIASFTLQLRRPRADGRMQTRTSIVDKLIDRAREILIQPERSSTMPAHFDGPSRPPLSRMNRPQPYRRGSYSVPPGYAQGYQAEEDARTNSSHERDERPPRRRSSDAKRSSSRSSGRNEPRLAELCFIRVPSSAIMMSHLNELEISHPPATTTCNATIACNEQDHIVNHPKQHAPVETHLERVLELSKQAERTEHEREDVLAIDSEDERRGPAFAGRDDSDDVSDASLEAEMGHVFGRTPSRQPVANRSPPPTGRDRILQGEADSDTLQLGHILARMPSPELVLPCFTPLLRQKHPATGRKQFDKPPPFLSSRPEGSCNVAPSLPTPPASEQDHPLTAAAVNRTAKSDATRKPIRARRSLPRTPESLDRMFDRTNWVAADENMTLKHGKPPIWCAGRQELCESLPYFKAYQGGHYDFGERCFGYLLDGFGAANDCCLDGGRVIVSHGGGCATASGGNYRLSGDQTRDNVRMRALYNCKARHTPVALLAGQNWKFFPKLKDMDVRYAVLGYYFVRDIWVEAEASPTEQDPTAYFTRFKILFEWAPSQADALRAADLASSERKAPIAAEGLIVQRVHSGDLQGWTIELGPDARIHQVWSTAPANRARADQLFIEYQSKEASDLFKRIAGGGLCSQFSFNAGERYHYGAATDTYPFDRPLSASDPTLDYSMTAGPGQTAPPCVRKACETLTEFAGSICRHKSGPAFNEVLSVAYMEGGKMSFHDDGEVGLGPVVASLSLGSDADMTFRRKIDKKRKNETKVDEKPVPATKSRRKYTLRLNLRHGDVIIMEGRGVQQQFDHMVQPVNLRYAATARFIGPEHELLSKRKAVGTTRAKVAAVVNQGKPAPIAHKRRTAAEVSDADAEKNATPVAYSSLPHFKKSRIVGRPSTPPLIKWFAEQRVPSISQAESHGGNELGGHVLESNTSLRVHQSVVAPLKSPMGLPPLSDPSSTRYSRPLQLFRSGTQDLRSAGTTDQTSLGVMPLPNMHKFAIRAQQATFASATSSAGQTPARDAWKRFVPGSTISSAPTPGPFPVRATPFAVSAVPPDARPRVA
ncbi:hypothetical protein OIV83_006057 [Microbotryomycetes sp. JL201]|nr:hypothetical protein OIV83_006057 [Microbotryomycetes sp. JL201]